MDLVEDDVVAAVGYSAVSKHQTCEHPTNVVRKKSRNGHMEGVCERTAIAGAVADDGGAL